MALRRDCRPPGWHVFPHIIECSKKAQLGHHLNEKGLEKVLCLGIKPVAAALLKFAQQTN
jgi:hypothetical protein